MRHLMIALALTGMLACSAEPSVDRLADAYVDLLRYRDWSARADTVAIRAGIDSVLSAHGFTGDAYQSTFASLAEDPDRLTAFFARVDQRLTQTNPALQPQP
jgi:hypothetical protein